MISYIDPRGLKNQFNPWVGLLVFGFLVSGFLFPTEFGNLWRITKLLLPAFGKVFSEFEFATFLAVLVVIMFSETLFKNHWVAYGVRLSGVVIGIFFLAKALFEVSGWHGLTENFGHHAHLLFELTLLLIGFELIGKKFEESGLAQRLVKYANTPKRVSWSIFTLSTVLDNIASALIGAIMLRKLYGSAVSAGMAMALIATSNNGGAASPVGDTTTIMLFLAYKVALPILVGFFATIPVQWLLIKYIEKHANATSIDLSSKKTPVEWKTVWLLMGIPGLAIGNIFFHQAGLGLWIGMGFGLVIEIAIAWKKGEIQNMDDPNHVIVMRKLDPGIKHAFRSSWQGVVFLVLLVYLAGLLPLEKFAPVANIVDRFGLAFIFGELSAFFDNIPLTALAISMGGFTVGFLAYEVGFKGSYLWFGSSAGVAVSKEFPEIKKAKNMLEPFFMLQVIGMYGTIALLFVYKIAFPIFLIVANVIGEIGIISILGILLFYSYQIFCNKKFEGNLFAPLVYLLNLGEKIIQDK